MESVGKSQSPVRLSDHRNCHTLETFQLVEMGSGKFMTDGPTKLVEVGIRAIVLYPPPLLCLLGHTNDL
eukprot:SAG25_NODE_1004_length_4345_cov_2.492463_1_plen_69_part_00